MVALRKESAIVERQFVSTWSGKTYKGWYLDGRMVGCSCPYHAAHPFTECKHMASHNDELAHIEDELRGSCCYCGRPTKGIVCWKCLS